MRRINFRPSTPYSPFVDWGGLARAFLFFWFFSGLCHALLLAAGSTGFFPFRQGLLVTLLWLIPLLAWPRQARPLAALIGIVLWFCSLINLGYFTIYRQEFSQSVLFIIFESNPAESREYLGQYFAWWMVPAVIAYTAFCVWLWRCVRPLRMRPAGGWLLTGAIVAILVVSPLTKVARKGFTVDGAVAALASRFEPVSPWQFIIGFARYKNQLTEMQELIRRAERIPPIGGLVDRLGDTPRTVVLVIGESTNRQHMGLYGYARNTSPRLGAMRDRLTVFDNVYGPRPYTIEALQQVLTFADQEHPNLYLSKPSLMSIMKQAGYRTYWITNQQTLTQRNTMLTSFSEQMDEQYYLNNSRSQNSYEFDGNVLEPFGTILRDEAPRRFIIVHLLGTHMRYKYRYPDEFERFKDRTGLPDWVSESQLELINEYDNAVLYNDHIVASLIEQLARASGDGKAMLVYFSDHGEDVFDSGQHDFNGRNEQAPTVPMYAVPFLLWQSDAWRAGEPRRFDAYTKRIYQTSRFIHTWADLVGLDFEGFEASKSLVNPAFKERPILVGDPGEPSSLRDLLRPSGTARKREAK